MRTTPKPQIPSIRVGVLGLITITVYGSWFYAFGVLLDPIIEDTGWGEAALASAFGISSLIAGFGGLAGGWLLDRFGSRMVFGLGALLGGGSFLIAASAGSVAVFALSAAVGGGVFASLGFYHVTQTSAVRISPGLENRAIAVLTIWGAFASAVFIPLAAWLLSLIDWRATLRILTLSAALALALGALAVDTRDRALGAKRPPAFRKVGRALRDGRAKRFLVSQGLAGIGVATILVYQVPAMTAAGLALGGTWLWEVDGQPVALSGYGGRTPRGIRIGPVYTPPSARRQGYATALVAEQTEWLLAGGRDFCFLFTDMSSPTPNSIYRRIGYRKIADALRYGFSPT